MIKKSRNLISACRNAVFLYALSPSIKYRAGIFCFVLLSAACRSVDKKAQTTHAPATKNFFTDSSVVKYAKGFSITYFKNYKLVKVVTNAGDRADTSQYVLVQRGTPEPANFPQAQKIEIPIKRMIALSSPHIALADFGEAADVIIGLGDTKYVNSTTVIKNIKEGKVKGVGGDGTLNNEVVITLHPDLVMAVGNPEAKSGKYQTLAAAGIPVLLNSEWLETTPLGRAEWVKLMGALLNKEALVNKKFAIVEQEYKRLSALAQKAATKPSVIIGMPFKGTWFVPDGDSFVAQFLRDAGSTYNWSETKKTGSIALSFEAVAPVALNADFWLNVGFVDNKSDIAAKDRRYTYFKPFVKNTIYNFNKRVNEIGSNDYWESGAVNPHLVLADLIKILHPELLPAHQLVYYKQLL